MATQSFLRPDTETPASPCNFKGIRREKKSLATTRVARDSHYPLIYLYLKGLLKIGGRQLETVYNKAVWLHLHVQYIALNLCI